MELKAKTMIELIAKVYRIEGWRPVTAENRTRRVQTFYTLRNDLRRNVWTATRRTGEQQ